MVEHLLVAVLLPAAGHHYDYGHRACRHLAETCGVGKRPFERYVVGVVVERHFLRLVRIRRLWRLRPVAFYCSELQVERKRHAALPERAFQHAAFQSAFIFRHDGIYADFHVHAFTCCYFGRYPLDALVRAVHRAGEASAVAFGYVEHDVELCSHNVEFARPTADDALCRSRNAGYQHG